MAKADWGAKHTCQSCGAKYYDLNRTPVTCPKCGTAFHPDVLLRSRRARSAPSAKAEKVVVAEPAESPVDDELDEVAALVEDEEDGDEPIEDPSELGEDDVDMAEVVIEEKDDDDS